MILEAKQLVKRFKHPADLEVLRGIDLAVNKGETVAIMGASGEGKSTLLHILGTLEEASSGSLEIAGETVSKRNAPKIRNTTLGFVFQSFYLFNELTVLENVLMPARIARKDGRKRAEELIEQVGLKERMKFPAKLLSGGEKQRVAIARALCNDPPLIFADEPSGNLDHKTSEVIYDLLIGLVRDHGKTLITVTHDQRLASICDRTYILEDGILSVR